MRKAIIDLGTNTFNLLIGDISEAGLDIVHSQKIPVMLGMGGINEGRIAPDAYQRAMDALTVFKLEALSFKVDLIKGIATSAVRGASNGQQLVDEVFTTLGFQIDIVDGKREAELIFKGVQLTKDIHEDAVIMDIGGGSTEFIHVSSSSVLEMTSLNIGVSRIYQNLNKPENYTAEEKSSILAFLEKEASTELNYNSNVLIGASGTFETFYEMIYEKNFVSDGKAVQLDWDKFIEVLNWSVHASLEDRNDHPWIVEMRKRMLPIGALKVKWIIERLGIREVWLSPYSLKEGAFIS